MPRCGRVSCSCLPLLTVVLVLFHLSAAPAAAQGRSGRSSPWRTLRGDAPLVVANGGHSGLFPDSSSLAYGAAIQSSLPGTLLWCNLQLTKDSVGICLPDVRMDNCTNIAEVYPKKSSSYSVNGVPLTGYFSLDYNFANLSNNVSLFQGVYSRTPIFDGLFPILSVKDLETLPGGPRLWLNIQYAMFYTQHNLNMRTYLLSIIRGSVIDYVSSPEVSFLRSIPARFTGSKTQLVFRFLDEGVAEPSTNQTYGSLLKNLTFIKTFASGILVPKNYIWPMNASSYLQPSTSVVLDAHKAGLKVFAADFANDNIGAYDYYFNPISEYLSVVDDGAFSVDGVLSDFPVTASAAIGCFSHINKTGPETGKPIVISHNGASGIYPGCSNLAYKQALDDGADYIDCPVQVTKDGVLLCMDGVDLSLGTTVLKSPFNTRSSIIPEIQSEAGVFTFNLTWEEIQNNLKPQISTPFFSKYRLLRNPLHTNDGVFMTLTNFLEFAKDKSLSGILISIENAAFLAEKLGFSVTDAVLKALSDLGYDNQTSHKVIIRSSSSSVLVKMKQLSRYELMYTIDEDISDAISSSIKDISEFAHSVAIRKQSIYPESDAFTVRKTDLVAKFKKANISVYAYWFLNEYVSQAWDFFSDPTAEINTYFQDAHVDGFITDYPATAVAYRRSSCPKSGKNIPSYMLPVQPGGLEQLLMSLGAALPPAVSPMPALTDSDVVEPPLPAASVNISGASGSSASPTAQPPPNGQPSMSTPAALCLVTTMMGFFLLV